MWYLRDLVIYGEGDEIRSLTFLPGVNVITGDSQTGKSAVIPIVDYCLGAKTCQIPVGPIREFARWYGLRIQAGQEQLFVAREDPGRRISSGRMHLLVGREVAIPPREALTGNTDRKAVIDDLSRRLGIPDFPLAESEFDAYYTDPPSVRSAAHFLFQPQNVVADKDVLFYKTKDPDQRKRLQRVLPFFLGVVDLEYFQLRGQIEATRRSIFALARQLERERALLESDETNGRFLLAQAIELGLAHPTEEPASEGDPRARLGALVETRLAAGQRPPPVGADGSRMAELERASRSLRDEVDGLRMRRAELEALRDAALGAGSALGLQAGRLRAVELLPPGEHAEATCPLCSGSLEGVLPTVQRMRDALGEVEREIGQLSAAPPALTEALRSVTAEFAEARGRLGQVEQELNALRRANADAVAADDARAAQDQLLGAIRFYLENWPVSGQKARAVEAELRHLEKRLAGLREELEDFDVRDREQAALSAISAHMLAFSSRLKLERPGSSLWLDLKNLTVVRNGPNGPERLWQIGGGENHIGYHLCALFALHRYFLHHERPVPPILIIDQPSQVYFPEEPGAAGDQDGRDRTDWAAVRKIYDMIFTTTAEFEGRLQVIVLDHANFQDEQFQTAVRRRWRDGEKLI